MFFVVLFTVLVLQINVQSRLTVDTTTNTFKLNGNTVFLSGVNQPWDQYGNDFGNDQSNGVFCTLNYTLANMSMNGGNSVREWLFVEGTNIPQFDSNGNVIGTDASNSLINDVKLYLQAAAAQNILVFFSLWNGAISIPNNLRGLITDTSKLQTFIDNALIPLVKGVMNEPGLGGWEIINEPEGSTKTGVSNNNKCYDTTGLSGSGADWTGSSIQMEDFLTFISLQVDAIHSADPNALVTVGSWCERSVTDNFGYTNYYKDECMQSASGGKSGANLDFYEVHTYKYNGQWSTYSPFNGQNFSSYSLDKPLVVGEFSSVNANENVGTMYNYCINQGNYNGCWDWSATANDGFDNTKLADEGVLSISNNTQTNINLNANSINGRCWCSDIPPDNSYTCQQQATWGKCDQTWMQGYCCQSCNACQGCS